jgi:hypothetical protein
MKADKKIAMLIMGILLVAMGITVVMFTIRVVKPEAKVGEMTVKCGDTIINPVSNILQINKNGENSSGSELELSDISSSLPQVVYDGDITVNYSLDTMDDFSFSMYDENLNEIYADSDHYKDPEKAGTYIVKIVFSWGNDTSNSIKTENYFKIRYDS